MASPPYLCTPIYYPPTPYIDPYYHQQHSPFLPPPNLQTLPPQTPPRRGLRFEDEEADGPYAVRPRVLSWHAGMPTPVGPVPLLYTPPQPVPVYTHNRRHSFHNTPFQPPWGVSPDAGWAWPPQVYQAYPPQPYLPRSLIHPFLNGESSPPPIYFDLSVSSYSPQRMASRGQPVPLTNEELSTPATHPATTRMRITCDAIPQWPMELKDPSQRRGGGLLQVPWGGAPTRPISVNDVLAAIHAALQTQITHMDWAKLSRSDEMDIARAYTRRCRSFPSVEQFEARQGVRRVDYLMKKYMFKGLVRAMGDDGFDNLKLLVGPPD